MKSRIASIILTAMLSVNTWGQIGVYSNPILEAALLKAKSDLHEIHVEQKKEMTKLQTAMAAVDVNLERIHKVENQWLDYLKTSYNTIQSAYQIVDITNYLIDIPDELKELGDAMKNKPDGILKYGAVVAWGAFHNEEGQLWKRVVQSYNHAILVIKELVMNGKEFVNKDSLITKWGTYADGTVDTTMTHHKAILLNSRERMNLLDQLRNELCALKNYIREIKYMVYSITWWGVWRGISPETYWAFINGEELAKQVIATYKD